MDQLVKTVKQVVGLIKWAEPLLIPNEFAAHLNLCSQINDDSLGSMVVIAKLAQNWKMSIMQVVP